MVDAEPIESKFEKSLRNRKTENAGLAVLLRDRRFQFLATPLKRELAERLGIAREFGTQAFDAVMTDSPAPPVTALNLPEWIDRLHLIEMKTTRRPVDERLSGFFFGVTDRELRLAERLGDRYLFAFVVLNRANIYADEFFVLLTADELEQRIRTKRIQYQVNLVRAWIGGPSQYGSGPVPREPLARAAETPEPYG